MKITERKLVYLTISTEGWIEPAEADTTYLELVTKLDGGRLIDGRLSVNKFPKALLEYQLSKMAEKLQIPFLPNCLVGRWGFKKAIKLAQSEDGGGE